MRDLNFLMNRWEFLHETTSVDDLKSYIIRPNICVRNRRGSFSRHALQFLELHGFHGSCGMG
jgi:hypothetical protein